MKKPSFIVRGALFATLLALMPARQAPAQEAGAGFGVQTAWENPMQNIGDGQSKPGYQKIQWEPGAVMPVKLRDGMLTVINFPEWETIKDAYVGDKDFFDGRPVEKNTFMISPVDGRSMADTNLFIFGASGNKYVFYLKSEPFTTDKITASIIDVAVPIRYKKGQGAGQGLGQGGGLAGMKSLMGGQTYNPPADGDWEGEDFGWIKSIPVDPTEFRFDLDVFIPNPDDYVIAPERVWRDQVFTYIDFGEKALNMNQRPVVSLLVEDGESPVGFRTEGPQSRLLVVEAVGDMVLRSGGRIVCIKLRSKPYLLSNPPPPQELIAISGAMPGIGSGGYGGYGGAGAGYGAANPASAGYYGADSGAGYSPYGQAYGPGNGAGYGGATYAGAYGMNGYGAAPGGQAYGYEYPAAALGANPSARAQSQAMAQQAAPAFAARGGNRTNASFLPNHHVPLVMQNDQRVSIEIFKGKSVVELEAKWLDLTERHPWLDEYTPFYSVETSGVDELGQQRYYGGEFYRLRIGPFGGYFNQLEAANETCQKLAMADVPCSIVRTQ
ncbi:MAG: TrbG/VirB9 family P-type conjugative transfer protein [Rickettsiales bacterium]|jgi:type IV secretory pathway VirB9-like protein|nr:TrbG/VirB9 family P-type conjugative transfer protein [Rickettsiales bacterium]